MSFSSVSQPLVVNVVSAGRFTAFDLARELDRRDLLGQLYTTYPPFLIRPHYDGSRVHSNPWLMAPQVLGRLGLTDIEASLGWIVSERFDRWAAKSLETCSVVHALSSWCLYVGTAARKKYGAIVAYDRGSAHLGFEDGILQEEAARLGTARRATDRRFLEKDEAECRMADVIILPSTFAKRTFVEHGVDASKIRVVGLAANLQMFRPGAKKDTVFRIAFAGRIGLGKGIIYLLRAVARLLPHAVEVVVFGEVVPGFEIPLREFEDMVSIKWRGAVPQHVLAEELAQASVFVLPSLSDGFGMVVAQAMGCGVPVIVSENTGAADLVEEGSNGFIVPIRDPEAIREKLQFLCDRPDICAEMGVSALRSIQALGGWKSYAAKVVDVYQEALHAPMP